MAHARPTNRSIQLLPSSATPIPGHPHFSHQLSPIDQEELEHAAGSIRLRGDHFKVLLKWKTARRLALRKAA